MLTNVTLVIIVLATCIIFWVIREFLKILFFFAKCCKEFDYIKVIVLCCLFFSLSTQLCISLFLSLHWWFLSIKCSFFLILNIYQWYRTFWGASLFILFYWAMHSSHWEICISCKNAISVIIIKLFGRFKLFSSYFIYGILFF